MSEEIITQWLKAGYPYFKEKAGLPPWLLPARSLELAADELQGSGILRLSRPLKLAGNIEAVHDRMPDPSVFTAEVWQEAVSQWPPLSRVKAVVESYLEMADRVTAQLDQWRDRIDPAVICRSLAVLLLASFVPQGKQVMKGKPMYRKIWSVGQMGRETAAAGGDHELLPQADCSDAAPIARANQRSDTNGEGGTQG